MAKDRANDPRRVPILERDRSGNVIHPGRIDEQSVGRTPSITDIHEAVMEGHINVEEGSDLNEKYQPDRYKRNQKGERVTYNPYLQNQHIYTNMVKDRRKKQNKKKMESD